MIDYQSNIPHNPSASGGQLPVVYYAEMPGQTGMPGQAGMPAAPTAAPGFAENAGSPIPSGVAPVGGAVLSTSMPAAVPPGVVAGNGVPTADPEEPAEKGISIITREATVLGDIITEGHIDIIGKVRGNVSAQGDVAVHGQVRGDIGGEKIGMYNSRVRGNLNAGQGIIVDENSIIDGDVNTKNIIFDGKVKGNIDAESVVVLRSHSYTLGDVTASSLAVEPGAIINGNVRTIVDGDLEAPFEDSF